MSPEVPAAEVRERTTTRNEHTLRNELLVRIEALPLSAFGKLVTIVREFVPKADATRVATSLGDAIVKAQRSYSWNGGGTATSAIHIGYYRNPAEYYTTMLHESLHAILSALGRDLKTYMTEPYPEEDACWRFAQEVASICSLPYDAVREELSRDFYVLEDKLKEKKNEHLWDAHIAKERQLTGFSEYGGDTFTWIDDEPRKN